MEPRARATNFKGKVNFPDDLTRLIHAFGAPADPSARSDQTPSAYPETLRTLDEIVVDYIIELSHNLVRTAHYAGRQKIKLEDVFFILRHDPVKLARVQEMLKIQKEIADARKTANTDEAAQVDQWEGAAKVAGMETEAMGTRGVGRGRGRKRKERPPEETAKENGLTADATAADGTSEAGESKGGSRGRKKAKKG